MIRNYLKTALRNLLRYKGFALINIASLTIGIVGCLVIGLFVYDERQYDKNIPGGENVYRIYEEYKNENATTFGASVPPAYASFLIPISFVRCSALNAARPNNPIHPTTMAMMANIQSRSLSFSSLLYIWP